MCGRCTCSRILQPVCIHLGGSREPSAPHGPFESYPDIQVKIKDPSKQDQSHRGSAPRNPQFFLLPVAVDGHQAWSPPQDRVEDK